MENIMGVETINTAQAFAAHFGDFFGGTVATVAPVYVHQCSVTYGPPTVTSQKSLLPIFHLPMKPDAPSRIQVVKALPFFADGTDVQDQLQRIEAGGEPDADVVEAEVLYGEWEKLQEMVEVMSTQVNRLATGSDATKAIEQLAWDRSHSAIQLSVNGHVKYAALAYLESAICYSCLEGEGHAESALKYFSRSVSYLAGTRAYVAAAMIAELAAYVGRPVTSVEGIPTMFLNPISKLSDERSIVSELWFRSAGADLPGSDFMLRRALWWAWGNPDGKRLEDIFTRIAKEELDTNEEPVEVAAAYMRAAWTRLDRVGVDLFASEDWKFVADSMQSAMNIWKEEGLHTDSVPEAEILVTAATGFTGSPGLPR